MKKTYEAPELEVTAFEAEDVITSSGVGGGNTLPVHWDDDDQP